MNKYASLEKIEWGHTATRDVSFMRNLMQYTGHE